jgi:hypothetical protein
MRITEMNAKDCGKKVRIYVSERVKNMDCDDFRPHWGWWYCVVGGQVGYFVTKRPYSGVCLQGKLESYEHDIFNVNGTIETKEQFKELLEL